MSRYSVGRRIARQIMKEEERKATGRHIQREASERPESKLVQTTSGEYWMSPIEAKLHEAMRQRGLDPIPQFRVEAYHLDFAFPDIKLGIEADGVAYHTDDRKEHDRKRDGFLWSRGWTVKHFYGSTINDRADNCAHVVWREVESRRKAIVEREEQREAERMARNAALAKPFRRFTRLFKRE